MKKPKEKRRRQPPPPPAALGPENVLDRNEDDAGGNKRLDHPLGKMDKVQRRQRQCDCVGKRECRHDFDEVPKGGSAKNQRADKKKMVVSGENVANAVNDIVFED